MVLAGEIGEATDILCELEDVFREFEQLLVLPLLLLDRRPLLVGDDLALGEPGNPVLLQHAEQRAEYAQNQIADAITAMERQDPSVQTTRRARMPVELGAFLCRPGHCQIIPRPGVRIHGCQRGRARLGCLRQRPGHVRPLPADRGAAPARGVDGAAHRAPLRA
jgi:hypothetical protein